MSSFMFIKMIIISAITVLSSLFIIFPCGTFSFQRKSFIKKYIISNKFTIVGDKTGALNVCKSLVIWDCDGVLVDSEVLTNYK